jgi:hypothetical protein
LAIADGQSGLAKYKVFNFPTVRKMVSKMGKYNVGCGRGPPQELTLGWSPGAGRGHLRRGVQFVSLEQCGRLPE